MSQGRPRHRPSVTLDKNKLDVVARQHGRLSLVDSIFEMIVAQISSGDLSAGMRLHSVRQLAEDCQVSRDTVARGYDKLVAHGHLESRAGSGFYVKLAGRPVHRHIEMSGIPVILPEWSRFRLLQPAENFASTTGLGLLPADWLDGNALGSAMRTVARSNQRYLSCNGDALGYLPLRQQLQAKLKESHVQAEVNQIMITAGASHALHLVVLALLRAPGEHVLVEDPGPPLMRDRLMAAGLELVGIPRRPDGPDMDVLREMCQLHRPRFFFCSAILQNPTSTQIAPHKAYQILRLAEEFDLTIVEDATYSDLMPVMSGMPLTTLASLDQLQRVIHVGSFSKTVAPGLRVGYVCAHPKVMEWLLVYRTVSEISGSSFSERVVYQMLSGGGYRHQCAQLCIKLNEVRQPVIDQLGAIGCTFDHIPDTGIYVWATLPGQADAERIADTMYQQGHLMAPGGLFSSTFEKSKMRFNISRTLDSPALMVLARLLQA